MTFNGLLFTWHWSFGTILALLALCLLYGLSILRMRRSDSPDRPLKNRQLASFATAIFLLALMLLTPIDTIARTQLFSVHMMQAVVLITFCAPLLLFACPDWLFAPLLQHSISRSILKFLTQPVIASGLFNLTFLLWHAPVFYNLALRQGTLYHIMLFSFLLTSLLNWWPLIGPERSLHKMSYPTQMLYAFLDGQPVDIFAFLLVFSGVVFYPAYTVPPGLGISAFADQAVGGALLMLPGLVDLVVMSPLFFRWLAQIEQKARQADQRRQELTEAEEEAEADMENTEASPWL